MVYTEPNIKKRNQERSQVFKCQSSEAEAITFPRIRKGICFRIWDTTKFLGMWVGKYHEHVAS